MSATKLIKANFETPIGNLIIVLEGDTIVICEFADHADRVEKQLAKFYHNRPVIIGDLPHQIATAFTEYFNGNLNALSPLKAKPLGTSFQQRVWHELQNIPYGTTSSYGDLATQLKSSPRAVGGANGSNPVCLIFPCHRVIGANGSLTGYAGGIERKEWLLKHEGAILNL